jgi:hypothetical protein
MAKLDGSESKSSSQWVRKGQDGASDLSVRAVRRVTEVQLQLRVRQDKLVAEATGAWEQEGLRINTPAPGSPATKAGVRAGDLIVELDGAPLKGLSLADVLAKLRVPANTTTMMKGRKPLRDRHRPRHSRCALARELSRRRTPLPRRRESPKPLARCIVPIESSPGVMSNLLL